MQGRISEADTQTIRLDATPSALISNLLSPHAHCGSIMFVSHSERVNQSNTLFVVAFRGNQTTRGLPTRGRGLVSSGTGQLAD